MPELRVNSWQGKARNDFGGGFFYFSVVKEHILLYFAALLPA
jgi:hypothetical protein